MRGRRHRPHGWDHDECGPGGPWAWKHRHHHRHHGLHRHLFIGFGVAIIVTAATMWLVFWTIGGGSKWGDEVERMRALVTDRYAATWDRPAERSAFGAAIAAHLQMGVRVYDASGALLEAHGAARCERDVDVAVAGKGTVSFCLDGHAFLRQPGWLKVLALCIPAVILWGLAGLWARRLSRPLRELTQVARDLGEGRLERRARLRHDVRGEVGELTHALNEMAARIEKQIRDQRELLAGVSHEMRTPLQRIRLLLELGRDGQRQVFDEIEGECVEIDRLVGDLLANARLDFGTLARRDLDAVEAARRAVARSENGATKIDAPAEPPRVSADPTLLQRALGALLDNARKHAGGAAVLRVAVRDGRVIFEVEDDGPGIADADLPHVFDPFYRGRNGDGAPGAGADESRAAGIGLGLAIVRRIAEAHRGRAFARSLTPRGACVGLEIPSGAPAS